MDRLQQPAATTTERYFRRFGYCERQIKAPPGPDLGLVVAMPCYDEPDVLGALESLWACERPGCAVEVIVVMNAPETCGAEVRARHQAGVREVRQWAAGHNDPRLLFHVLDFPELPARHAGVGLARKIGMDEAIRRFEAAGKPGEGIIAGYDADCRCAPNYLRSLETHFRQHPRTPGCSIYFELPLAGPLKPEVYEAAAAYELHLRYYVQALRFAGFPHAHHTIGSCMAVRTGVYQEQGGMNKRQGGEDFYFLHKIIPLGGFTDLVETTVYPSPRASDRVPFGTGRAMRLALEGQPISTYPLEAFLDLKRFFEQLPALDQNRGDLAEWAEKLPPSMRRFLAGQWFVQVVEEIQANTASPEAFRKRFFRWFDGFQVFKCIRYLRDHGYGERPVESEARRLLQLLQIPAEPLIRGLLPSYRELERDQASRLVEEK